MALVTRRATAADAGPIGELLAANSQSNGGSLTGDWSPHLISPWLERGGTILVAEDGSTLLGALLADEKAHAKAPVVRRMIAVYPGADTAYVYGPVCVAESGRGRGILAALHDAARGLFANREAILFIRADNTRSLRAHEKLGMRIVGDFDLDGMRYLILSDRTASPPLDMDDTKPS